VSPAEGSVTGTDDGPAPRHRRELAATLVLCGLAGAVALSASAQRWLQVTITRQPPLPPATAAVTGGQAAPLVPACGLLLLAAALALIAVRGPGRLLVGLLVAVAGGVLGLSGVRALTGGLDAAAARADVVGIADARVTGAVVVGWPALTVLAGVLAVLAGLLAVVRGRRWPGMGRRYERTGPGTVPAGASRSRPARPETAEDRHQAAWRALDRGEDPTTDPDAGRTA
jgi:uncharacterized membrane protein (TIGR02234 family)